MKILFIGVGLTDYYNQVLNKLTEQPDIEIFNLVASAGRGHTGDGVHQTTEGVKFKVIYSKETTLNKLSEYSYKSFSGLDKILNEIKPNIIVSSETYIKSFSVNKKLLSTIKDLNIKIIMKDIPFRLEKYNDIKESIMKGEAEKKFLPFFAIYFKAVCDKLKLPILPILLGKIIGRLGLEKLYKKIFAKKILLNKLESKKGLLNFPDAHVDYVEKAYEIFGSYGVPKEKIFIMYNSPDTDHLFDVRAKLEKEALILPHSDYRLIHVGRLIEWKRVDMLIRSLKKVKSEFKDAELLIIGTGPEENYLKTLIKSLELENSVKFLGGIYKPEDLGKYLLASTIYVLAGMGGISINDAMIFGKPVICSICDGTEKKLVYEGRNGLYFKDGDEDSLTDSIKKLLRNRGLIKKMGENSTEIIKNKVNIHTVIKGYLDAFNYVSNIK